MSSVVLLTAYGGTTAAYGPLDDHEVRSFVSDVRCEARRLGVPAPVAEVVDLCRPLGGDDLADVLMTWCAPDAAANQEEGR